MKFCCGLAISEMCLFLGSITTKVMHFIVMGDLRLPAFSSFLHPRKQPNPFESMFVSRFCVGSILPIGCFAQICKFIIRFISINMINLVGRPFTNHIKPRQTMSHIGFSINTNIDVSSIMQTPSFGPNLNFWSWGFPKKISRFRIILDNVKKCFMVKCFHKNHIAHFRG